MNLSRTPRPGRTLGVLAAVVTCVAAFFPAHASAYHASAQEQQDIAKLIADLQAIKAGSEVTDAEKQAIAADLELLATSTTKPSQASVDQLAEDLAAAFADGSLSVAEKAELTLDVDAVFNSAGLSTAQAEQFIADAKAVLVSSGLDAADVQLIASDLTAVAADLQINFLVTNTVFTLVPPTGTASGKAALTSTTTNDGTTTTVLSLSALGLTTGTYAVTATTSTDSTAVTLGQLKVVGIQGKPGAGAAVFGGSAGTAFPSGFAAADLATVTLTDASGTSALGGSTADAAKLTRLGNFRLVGGPAAPSAFGNAAFKVATKDAATKTHFLLYAWKLPASATLTLKLNGSAVGTVTTNDKGRLLLDAGNVVLPVKADGVTPQLTPTPLPPGTDLRTLDFLELDDSTGQIVATAGFSS